MFSIFNKNKTNSLVTTKNHTLTNDQLIQEDNIDPIIPSINKINVVEHNCNDLGNILTVSGLTIYVLIMIYF